MHDYIFRIGAAQVQFASQEFRYQSIELRLDHFKTRDKKLFTKTATCSPRGHAAKRRGDTAKGFQDVGLRILVYLEIYDSGYILVYLVIYDSG